MDSSTSITGHSALDWTEIIDDHDCLSQLPEEALLMILSRLTACELHLITFVNKRLNRVALDPCLFNAKLLTNSFPALTIIDASVWRQYGDLSAYGLDLENEPPLQFNFIPIYKKFSSLPIRKLEIDTPEGSQYENSGHTLLTIPKGTSLNKLKLMAKKMGIKFHTTFDALKEIADIEAKETYRILLTDFVLEAGRDDISPVVAADLLTALGYEWPKAYEVVAQITTRFAVSRKRLYNGDLEDYVTYTTDIVKDREKYVPVVVGKFNHKLTARHQIKFENHGIAARLKL